MTRIRTMACASLFLPSMAWGAFPCEPHRWDRNVIMTTELMEHSPEVFVGTIVAGSRVVEFRESERTERGEITPFAVELVVKGSFHTGDQIDAFRILKSDEPQRRPASAPTA